MHSVTLPVPQSFSLNECKRFLGRSSSECLHRTINGKLRKLLKVDKELLLIEISAPEASELKISFLNIKPDIRTEKVVSELVGSWFDLHASLDGFYTMARKESILAPIVKKYHGLRLIGIDDLFEAMSWAVTGQQINLGFAYTLKRRFTEAYGESLEFEDNSYYLYPSAAKIASLRTEDLTAMQFSVKKAGYITGIARSIASGELGKPKLQQQSSDEALRSLLQFRGVGEWTANYVLMKCLREPDAFPLGDAGLHNAIRQQLNLAKKPSLSEIENMASTWKGHRAYATFYLWRSLLND